MRHSFIGVRQRYSARDSQRINSRGEELITWIEYANGCLIIVLIRSLIAEIIIHPEYDLIAFCGKAEHEGSHLP